MPRCSSSRRNPATASGTPRSRAGDCTRTLTRASLAFLHGLAAEKEIGEELVPLVALVEREHRIDDLVLELVERAVHQPACRDAISAFQDLLPLFREHELGEKQRRVRVRRVARHADRGGLAERGLQGLPLDRRALQLQGLDVVVVRGEKERDFARGHALRRARASARARLTIFSADPRQWLTRTAYFCSNAVASALPSATVIVL